MREELKITATSSAISVVAGLATLFFFKGISNTLIDNVGYVSSAIAVLMTVLLVTYIKRSGQEETTDSRRLKEIVLFGSAVALIVIVSGVCLWVIASGTFSNQERTWAISVLTLIGGGVVGYLTGRVSKN